MTPFRLKIITPDKIFFDGMTEGIIVKTTVGEKGILARHEAYAAALVIGQMKVNFSEGKFRMAAISSGIVKVSKEMTVVLAQSCEWCDEIDIERAKRAKSISEEIISKATEEREITMAEFKLKRAINRIDTASKK